MRFLLPAFFLALSLLSCSTENKTNVQVEMIEYYYFNQYDSVRLSIKSYAVIEKNRQCLMEADIYKNKGKNRFKYFKIDKKRFTEFITRFSSFTKDTFLLDKIDGGPFVKFIYHSDKKPVMISLEYSNNPFYQFKEHLDSMFANGKILKDSTLLKTQRNRLIKNMCSKEFPESIILYPFHPEKIILKKPDFLLADTLFH
jgi:hypothetical protein